MRPCCRPCTLWHGMCCHMLHMRPPTNCGCCVGFNLFCLSVLLVALFHVQCMICFEDFSRKDMRSAACKHGFCVDCWSGYIINAIGNGPAVLDLRCPLPKCNAEVRDTGVGSATHSHPVNRVGIEQSQQRLGVHACNCCKQQ